MALGEYAGYLFEFDDETGETSGNGIALAAEVRKMLLAEANSPEAIADGKWKMTMPFDPRGEKIRINIFSNPSSNIDHMLINNLSIDTRFLSPFTESVLAGGFYYQNQGIDAQGVKVRIPESILEDSKKGIKYGFNIRFRLGEMMVDNTMREVDPDELLFVNLSNDFLPTPPFPAGNQVIISIESETGPFDLSFDNFLESDNSLVFALS